MGFLLRMYVKGRCLIFSTALQCQKEKYPDQSDTEVILEVLSLLLEDRQNYVDRVVEAAFTLVEKSNGEIAPRCWVFVLHWVIVCCEVKYGRLPTDAEYDKDILPIVYFRFGEPNKFGFHEMLFDSEDED